MKIENIRIKNFKSFQNVEFKNIPNFCVLLGKNGVGKTTLFQVFQFLKEAYTTNVKTALNKLGGSRGFEEVMSRNSTGNIEIEIKFRAKQGWGNNPLITYFLSINKDGKNQPFITREILKYRRGSGGQPWHFIDFHNGKGSAVTNELEKIEDVKELTKEEQTLKSNDILAIKSLSQMKKFPAAISFGELIENWHLSDIHINDSKNTRCADFSEQLSVTGDNLSSVVDYYYRNYKDKLEIIIQKMKQRIPGIKNVEPRAIETGEILLKIESENFEEPFLLQRVSDGTIKMLAYLVLLYDPNPRPLLAIEEPENQLYPHLLEELAEEFRSYTSNENSKAQQLFVSTHSPDFLNAVNIEEVFLLKKENGYTTVTRASDIEQVAIYMGEGDKMGSLWQEGFFEQNV